MKRLAILLANAIVCGLVACGGHVEIQTTVVNPEECYFDMTQCPYYFPDSHLVEVCTIPYACPVKDEGIVCVRFMQEHCWNTHGESDAGAD